MRGRAALGSRAARPPLAAGAGTGLLVFLGAVAFNVVTVDLAAPRAGRTAPLFDELLEATEIALDARVVGAEHVPDPLGDVLRLPAHLELDLRFVLDQRDETDDASIACARCAAPRDDLVWHLLGDLGVPLFDLARDLRPPVQTLVVELLYGFDAFHESRELLELGPLVVRDPDRNVRFDGFLDCWHSYDSSASLGSMRRLFALPFFVAAFSSSRCFASRGERVGG